MKDAIRRITRNHVLMMVLFCIVPLGLIFAGTRYFGLNRNFLYLGLAICVLSHVLMMKEMHGGSGGPKKDGSHESKKGGCH